MPSRIEPDRERLAEFCHRHGIRKLALFGSVLDEGTFRPQSDVDVLVEFLPDRRVTYFDLARMEEELAPLFGGRKIDLRTAEELHPRFRAEVLEQAEVQFAEG